jgi:cytochrome c-type biogenesis protein CcmH
MNGSMWIFAILAVMLVVVFSASLYWAGGRGRHGAPRGQSWWLVLAVPLAVVGLYAVRGTPQALSQPGPQADSSTAGTPDPAVMVQRLADHLKQHPEDMDGWLMLARSYATLGRYADAAAAYEHAQTKVMQNSGLLVNWIELRVMLAGRKFDARTQQLLDRAAMLAPDDPDVMLLRALAALDRGDKTDANALVDKLHQRFPVGTPDRENLDAAIEKWRTRDRPANPSALNPSSAPAPQAAMPNLNAMVQRLADRLKQHPDDMDGWLLLARSYTVMGRYTDADDAYQHAQTRIMQQGNLLANWIEVRLKLNGLKFDARSTDLLKRAVALAPDDPDVMLLRALAAFDRGDQAGGDALVDKLHQRFPPGTPERQNLDAALKK